MDREGQAGGTFDAPALEGFLFANPAYWETVMPIQLTCEGCGKEYTVPDAWSGRRAKCPKCGAAVHIPAFVVEPEPAPPTAGPPEEALGGDLTAADPFSEAFADVPGPATSAGPLGPPLPAKRRKRPTASGEPSIPRMLLDLVRTEKLLTAVVAAMLWIVLGQLYLLATVGLRVSALVVGGIFLVPGVVIVIGGLRGTRRRDRATDAGRATRIVGWFILGVLGIVGSFGAMLIAGKINVQYIPTAVNLASPFLVVSGIITLVSGLLLAYYVLVLLFPRANVFRIAGWGYVVVTIGLPLLGLMAGLALRGAAGRLREQAAEQAAAESEWEDPFAEGPVADARPPGRGAAPAPLVLPPQDTRSSRGSAPRESSGQASGSRPSGQPSGSRPSTPRPRSPGPPPEIQRQRDEARARSLQIRMRALVNKYGADRVVQIKIEGAPMSKFGDLVRHVRSVAGTQEHQGSMSGGRLWIATGPVDDVHALAARLDLGQYTVDDDAKTIHITFDPGKLP